MAPEDGAPEGRACTASAWTASYWGKRPTRWPSGRRCLPTTPPPALRLPGRHGGAQPGQLRQATVPRRAATALRPASRAPVAARVTPESVANSDLLPCQGICRRPALCQDPLTPPPGTGRLEKRTSPGKSAASRRAREDRRRTERRELRSRNTRKERETTLEYPAAGVVCARETEPSHYGRVGLSFCRTPALGGSPSDSRPRHDPRRV
jgi:hypothetical protein